MMRQILTIIFFSLLGNLMAQNTISGTYTNDVPTSYQSYDNSCNGPSAVIIITLPQGDSYTVTNVEVSYNMTAQGSGLKADQRSKITLENTNVSEAEVSGTEATSGTQTYNRNIAIANGIYLGHTQLIFQMQAMRTSIPTSPNNCSTNINRVDANSWTITVHYSSEMVSPKVGVNTAVPQATLDVYGSLKVGSTSNTQVAGTIRFNPSTQDFEGYNGQEWLSFTSRKDEEWRGGNITEKVSDTASDGAAYDNFGFSVSISGDYAIIGAIGKNIGGNSYQGKAYIFKRSGTSWNQEATITASDGAAFDYFGHSVSISGDYAIVGAPVKDIGANTNQGKAYIFKRLNTSWSQEAAISGSDGAADDQFGYSVSISGDYAIIGASEKNVGINSHQGKSYIFKRSGTSWNQEANITASDGAAYDSFGSSVSISGDYSIVGASNNDVNGHTNQGNAYIFKRSGTSWSQEAIISASDGALLDYFGESVSISGDYAIVGANKKNVNGNNNQGKAYIFKRSGTSWSQEAAITASDGAGSDEFGNSVSLSGDYAIVGALNKDVNENTNQGKAYVFKRSGSNWTEQVELVGSGPSGDDLFGRSVSISGNHVIVGAFSDDVGSNTDEGKVFFYSRE